MNFQKNISKKPLLVWNNGEDVFNMSKIIASGGVLAGCSDTVFGLLADVTNASREGLDFLKRRKNKPYIVLVTQDMLTSKLQANEHKLLSVIQEKLWPAPLTVITQLGGFDQAAYSSEGRIALRIPDHLGLQNLIANVGPLFSTSANLAGQPAVREIDQLDPHIAQHIQGFVVDTPNQICQVTPSTIILIVGDGYEVVREGVVSVEYLKDLLG